jgi:hypothetical protein
MGDFVKNAGKGIGFGETSKLDNFEALFGVKRPSEDSNAAALLAVFFGVDGILPLGEGISANI